MAGQPVSVPGVSVRILYDIQRTQGGRKSVREPFTGSLRAEFLPL